ncbi:hypothetical protein CDD82_2422 [Ophiocordyceps australis]|uniref:F-box domain-containing protein n=1 Tax=Ophiocordyceps australis TaxID=1399860 RepID=A0A2C5ZHL8_9HYPO|nr:hypothetical protein CDD82_2422 [Ophiocordyceps australis]
MATQTLVNLPLEVKTEIINWLRYRHDILHLIQTCRHFATIAMPLLYRFNVTHQGSECILWAVTHKPTKGTDASLKDNRSVLQLAIGNRGNVNVEFRSKGKTEFITALHLAASNGMTVIVQHLLQSGAKANVLSSGFRAFKYWQPRFDVSLSVKPTSEVYYAIMRTKWLPMLLPMVHQQHELVSLLFTGGAPAYLGIWDQDLAEQRQGFRALTIYHVYAAVTHPVSLPEHHVEMYNALFQTYKQHVDTKMKFWSEYAPLHIAVENGNLPAVRRLIGLGANIDVQCALGRTPLMIAILEIKQESPEQRRVMLEIIQTLLDNDANVGHISQAVAKETPLICIMTRHVPCWSSSECRFLITIIDLLVKHGADINQQSSRGKTLLHHVCHELFHTTAHTKGLKMILNHIVEKGADINMPVGSGMTMLRYCISNVKSVTPSRFKLLRLLNADIGTHEVDDVLDEWVKSGKLRRESYVLSVLKHHARHISNLAVYKAYRTAFDQANVELLHQLAALLPPPGDASELVAIALSKQNFFQQAIELELHFDGNYMKKGKSYLHAIVYRLMNDKSYKESQAIEDATFFVEHGTSLAIKDKDGFDVIQIAEEELKHHPKFLHMLYKARDRQRMTA